MSVSVSRVRHLLLYEYVKGMAERRGPYREAHLARIRYEREAGLVTSWRIEPWLLV